jgi:hypothetical protein
MKTTTTKTAFIKKAITAGMVVIMLVVSSAFVTNNSETKKDNAVVALKMTNKSNEIENRYYVVTAKEKTEVYSDGAYVVSNVATFDCESIKADSFREARVISNFIDYYNAEYKKDRNTYGVNTLFAFGYKTYDQAESARRKFISKYSSTPFLVRGFTTSCED